MKLVKIPESETADFFTAKTAFSPPVQVQGGTLERAGDLLRISCKRFKRNSPSRDYVKIVSGEGFVKWARGELRFREGDVLFADGIGEYEINGAALFLIYGGIL